MPRAKPADTKVSAQTPIAKENMTAYEMGTPAKEYAERVREAQSPSLEKAFVKARVADALERQGYPYDEIRDALKTL